MRQNDQSTTQLQNNISRQSPMRLAHRVMLLLAILLVGGNAAWGEEVEIYGSIAQYGRITIEPATITEKFVNIESNTSLRIYTNDDIGLAALCTGYSSSFLTNGKTSLAAGEYYNSTDKCYEIPSSDWVSNAISLMTSQNGLVIQIGNQTVSRVTLYTPGSAYELINETPDAPITKEVVPYATYVSNSNIFDLADALVSGAKYARIYLEKYGKTNAESGNLTITYDGNPITQCTGHEKYGWYLSEAGGIDPSKLNVTGLAADEMMKYNLAIVSSTSPLSGAQEPAWEKKTVYSLQREIKNRINASDEKSKIEEIGNLQSEILSKLDAEVGDFSKSLYAKWYVIDDGGNLQSVTGGNGSNGPNWYFDIRYSGLGDWKNEGNANILKFYTDQADNGNSSPANIESGNGWSAQIARVDGIHVPQNTHTSDYIGYKIVFEFSDDYDTSTNGADPGYRLRYVWTIVDPSAFTGELNTGGETASKTQTVTDRAATSVDVDLTTGAFAHSKLSGGVKYARFYLTDTEGNLVDPDGKMTVSYSGGTVTALAKAEQGFYIYDGPSGGDIADLTPSNISVQLTTPKAYKLYQVVGVFSTEMAEVVPENGAIPLGREPDWDLKYTYSFTYPAPTTNEISKTMEWRRRGMTADASTTDPETDWGTSWEELSVGQCVKWYVVDKENNVQTLSIGNSRQADTWTIDLPSPFAIDGNTAVVTGQNAVNATKWNSTWGKPMIYAPIGKNYDGPNGVKDYKIICEIAAEVDASATPNAKYTFSLVKSFFGEMKDGKEDSKDSETATIDRTSTSETVALGTALTKWGGTNAKYARVWLTDASGTMVDPTGLLSVTGMSTFDGHPEYGFYVSAEGGPESSISLSDATLALPAGQFGNYQVHVAISTDPGPGNDPNAHEPDYDFLYTFGFEYPIKVKYKTVMYDETSRQTTPSLMSNWFEVAGDCNASRQTLADKGYIRWYLENATTGELIEMDNLTSSDGYTKVASDGKYGYYRLGFNAGNFWSGLWDGSGYTSSIYEGYNPTITLPDGSNYNNVRVVAVVSAKTDDFAEPWTGDPSEMQIKYVYVLKTQTELENAPFVHYVGESHRPYKTVAGTSGADEYSYNYETGLVDQTTYASQNIRQDVYQQDYYVYLDPTNASAENLLLKLPMEHWDKAPSDKRNSTEPLGYFRWYDYGTDMKSDYLEAIGGTANKLDETNPRGLIALMLSGSSSELYRNEIGVKFTGLSALNANNEILIACDVSRYMDGLDDSKTYLVHEPTLTIRYLYHILPASAIANAIDEKATLLKQVNDGTKTYAEMTPAERVNMFKLYEDEGRVVVSLKGTTGKFALRAELQDLQEYFINKSGSPVQCSQMQWYCYYEDSEGLWKKTVDMGDRATLRLAKYEVSEFNGTYTKVGSSSETKDITIGNNTTVHLVGYIGDIGDGSVEQAVVHYGLEFLNEAPAALGSEPTHRKDEYMYDNLKLGNVLDFNNFFLDEATRFDKPTTSYENYAKIPMNFENAQYGFCYPQLYGQCASNWMINHGAGWDGYGFAPTHGDYTILKSMNMPGVSASQTYDNQSIYTFWYNDGRGPLYDVTHERLDPGKTGNDAKYGSFLYVDASDEARTISHLQFEAPLCAGSEIYYTAYIANMTGIAEQPAPRNHVPSQTPPQVMFRVSMDVTEGGVTKRVPVVSFLTGDLYTVGAREGTTWYQVYGYTRIPKEFENYVDGEEHTYYVSIDNYAENTDGADYAIDQISFFTSSASVKVNQSSTPCDEGSGVEVQIVAPYDELASVVGEGNTKTFFYRIFEKKSDDPSYVMKVEDAVPGPYKNSIATDANLYGSADFTASYDPNTLHVGKGPADGTTGIYKDSDDGKVYFQFDRREFDLKTGKTYFVSFYSLEKTQVTGFDDWGGPYGNKLCSSMFSNDITPKLLKIDMESGGESSDGTIGLGCGTTSVDKSFLITVQYPTLEGYSPHTDVMFDFYMGEKATFKGIKIGEGENVLYLEKALDHMRQKKNTPISSSSELPTDYDETYTQTMHDLLAIYVDNGLLQLKATRTFSYTFTTANTGEQKFAAIPVSRHTTDGDICSPLEFVFNVVASSNAPKMELGFDDVDYPEEYTKRVVRVGLEQLNNMRKATDSYKLHIPVSNYQNKGGSGIGNKLHFSNPYLMLSATNDPTAVINKKIAKVFDPNGGSSATDVYVNTNRMYLPLDFSGDNCEVAFHEGYYYEAVLSFYDEEDQSLDESDRCIGDLYLVFKVVPEFVTWNAREVGTDLYSGNWDDDGNWNRSERVELYKDDVNTHAQNSVTAGHPERYQNNAEIDERLTGRPAFVPMKFTYVTMLGNNHSPSLFSEDYLGKVAGTVQTGGDMINPGNGMGADTSPSGGSSNATDFIKYDMMVRYGRHANGGEGCFGHRYKQSNGSGGYGWANDPREASAIEALTKVYDVEKFYGNICKEIYFKPGAELRLQQRLTYEKVWVEKELVANKWYLMSAPLKGTYAGDMYVPETMKDLSMTTPADKAGRQMTEAFQPITFSTTAKTATETETSQPAYSRTKYPIYQRSWGQTAKVYTKTNDIRATDYSAKINFGSVSTNLVEWGHTYNDVQVPYTGYSGFAIRANKKDQKDGSDNDIPALIRLPKADTQYDYYQWDNTSPDAGKVTQTVTKGEEAYGRMVFDYTSGDQEQWSIPLANLQAQGTDEDGFTYYLVGNPFVASIDMGKFFGYLDTQNLSNPVYYSYNPKLEPVYYTYTAGTVTAVDAKTTPGIIRPLQAFIVKCKESDAPENIVFNRWTITDGNYTNPTLYVPNGSNGARVVTRGLTLKASNGSGASSASVNLSDEASAGYVNGEDVTTLFDSNLDGVPMVFTVAGEKAVSIDRRPALDMVPFGVACGSSSEMVQLTVDGGSWMADGQLYVLDAVTGSVTEVGMEKIFAVQPNDYGRYFLTADKDITGIRETLASEDVVVSVRDHVVTVHSGSRLQSVCVLNVNGAVVANLRDCGLETKMNLAIGGIYIVEIQTAASRKTVKIVVR